MNLKQLILLVVAGIFPIIVTAQEPILVSAIVRELTHNPNSAPIEWRSIPTKQPPVWTAKLEITQVLRGDQKFKGKFVVTSTADRQPEGNWRVVTPRLNIGNEGIWAIKRLANDSLAAVYSPYEVEEGVFLPLIKEQHDDYKRVLQSLIEETAKTESPQTKGQAGGHPLNRKRGQAFLTKNYLQPGVSP